MACGQPCSRGMLHQSSPLTERQCSHALAGSSRPGEDLQGAPGCKRVPNCKGNCIGLHLCQRGCPVADRCYRDKAKRSTGRAVLHKLQAQRNFDPADLLSFAGSLASNLQVRAAMPVGTGVPCVRACRVPLSCWGEVHKCQLLTGHTVLWLKF